jgi:hypothetical protein
VVQVVAAVAYAVGSRTACCRSIRIARSTDSHNKPWAYCDTPQLLTWLSTEGYYNYCVDYKWIHIQLTNAF